jgi:proteasome lid subunit RPN8/RPN11
VVRVEIACDPGPRAVRRPEFFLRDLDHARRLAAEAWADSRAVWVGEWHTHPRGDGTPSSADLGTYARLLAASDLQFDLFVSVIVTADSDEGWSRARLWPWLLESTPSRRRPPDLG